MHIVLVEPEIPQNTGNIARTCALTKTHLHLVHPLGFSLDDKALKRAGLDYWHLVDISEYNSFTDVLAKLKGHKFYFATTKGKRKYCDVSYGADDAIVFGKETKGLPAEIINKYAEDCIRIPMLDIGRSLNLANSVANVLYEALRQQGFQGLK